MALEAFLGEWLRKWVGNWLGNGSWGAAEGFMTRHWHWPTVSWLQSMKHRKRNFRHSQCKHDAGNFQHLLFGGCCNKVTSSIWNLSCDLSGSILLPLSPIAYEWFLWASLHVMRVCSLSAPSCPSPSYLVFITEPEGRRNYTNMTSAICQGLNFHAPHLNDSPDLVFDCCLWSAFCSVRSNQIKPLNCIN